MTYPIDKYIETVVQPLEARIGELRLSEQDTRMYHAQAGITTELGELVDQYKRYHFYKTPLDEINVIEELGDILFYVCLAIDAMDTTLEEVLDKNHRKLWKRYPEKFTKDCAVNRNLVSERQELES